MTCAEVMIQAYSEASGKTIDEVARQFGIYDLNSLGSAPQLSDGQAERMLQSLRKDKAGVLAWSR